MVLDNLSWMHDFFRILIRGRPWDADLWPHSISGLISEFSIAAEMLGLHVLRACRYGLRHGDASEDLVGQRRTQLEAKHRGGWQCDDSLKRYGKVGHLLSELKKVPKPTLEYGQLVQNHLEYFMHHPETVPKPPVLEMAGLGRPKKRRK